MLYEQESTEAYREYRRAKNSRAAERAPATAPSGRPHLCAILSLVRSERPAGPKQELGGAGSKPSLRSSRASVADRERVREAVRDVNFPTTLRGYDRAAVDRYVQEVNRLIAELEISSSPESAVKHALAEVSEETRALLERANETAENITARSRARADERLQQAEQEAAETREAAASEAEETRQAAKHDAQALVEGSERESRQLRTTAQQEAEEMLAEAKARVQKLESHAEAIWQERRRLLDDLRVMGQRLLEIADAAAAQFPPVAEAAARQEPRPGTDSEAHEKVAAVPTNRPPRPNRTH